MAKILRNFSAVSAPNIEECFEGGKAVSLRTKKSLKTQNTKICEEKSNIRNTFWTNSRLSQATYNIDTE